MTVSCPGGAHTLTSPYRVAAVAAVAAVATSPNGHLLPGPESQLAFHTLARLGSLEVGYFAQGHSLQTADGPGQGSNCEVRKNPRQRLPAQVLPSTQDVL